MKPIRTIGNLKAAVLQSLISTQPGAVHVRRLHPILEELSKEYSGKVDIYQIDVDKEQDLAAAFGIRSIPTLLMIPMKEEPRIMQGAMPKDQLKKAIDEFLLKQNNEAKQ